MNENAEGSLHKPAALRALSKRGVVIPAPEQVAIGREVPLEAIAAGAVLHPFCRISGANTRIGAGAVIGQLGPVTLKDTVCGPGTVLGCGEAEDAVFLGKELDDPSHSTGYGFRVRRGSIYEEDARSAEHTDTKMTILFPWVTLGSNINWCDLLMGGGTGSDDFSEVGSGAIHFNFTPRGDKATASLFGHVPGGVFLNQPRLFLGGNGSFVGPLRADFGAVTVAGARQVGSLKPGLNPGGPPPSSAVAESFQLEAYGSIKRTYDSQICYIGALAALEAWYGQARSLLAAGDNALQALYEAGRAMVALNIAERIVQLAGLAGRMERSLALIAQRTPGDARLAQQRALLEGWSGIEAALRAYATHHEPLPKALGQGLEEAAASHGRVYTRVIRALPAAAVAAGGEWLSGIEARVASPELLAAVPALGDGG
ncbi:MAG: hypothetical protein O7C61_10365 [SAR324 cluster bacterium]|nr:hypothetical protein [SAR324 cluster bacterium]